MSQQGSGNNANSAPVSGWVAFGGAQNEDIQMGNTQGPESGTNDNQGGGAQVGEGNHMDEDGVSNTGAAVNESESESESQEEQEATIAERIHPVTAGWIKMDGKYEERESFFPIPLVTFSIDAPDNIVCQICRVSELRLTPPGVPRRRPLPPYTDDMPAIMPCGHVAGAVCLETLMEESEDEAWLCPFCRMDLVYARCGHRIKPRVLTSQSIASLPLTLPMGGEIPQLCRSCEEDADHVGIEISLNLHMQEFRVTRQMHKDDPKEDTALWMLRIAEHIRQVAGRSEERDVKADLGFQSW